MFKDARGRINEDSEYKAGDALSKSGGLGTRSQIRQGASSVNMAQNPPENLLRDSRETSCARLCFWNHFQRTSFCQTLYEVLVGLTSRW